MVGILFHITLAVFMGTRRVFVAPAGSGCRELRFRWSESQFTLTGSRCRAYGGRYREIGFGWSESHFALPMLC